MSSTSKVELIPWDPESSDHVERLVQQRLGCGWHWDKVEAVWRGEQRSGAKCIYWIVISPDDPDQDEKLQLHSAKYPADHEPLRDTGAAIRGVLRRATQEEFHPVGHISLDATNPEVKGLDLGLPTTGVYWIKTFYISQALRSNGIGRAAMDVVESMAVTEPLCARTLALDTVHRDDQRREDLGRAYYGGVQKVSSQDWYGRRGYRQIDTIQNFYRSADVTGHIWDMKTVFMRKDIS